MSHTQTSYFYHAIYRNLYLTFFALSVLVFVTPVNAGWTFQKSGTSESLNALHFPLDESTGYVVGSRGVILKTTNGGSSWVKQSSRTKNHLMDVHFPVSNSVGYAVGINGTALKTKDGGKSWTKLNIGTSNHLYAVHFPVDDKIGYIGGASRTLLKTTDGGQTWQSQFVADGWVKAIHFPNDNVTGYVATIYGSITYVYKTVDGGNNWYQVMYLEDAFVDSINFPVDDMTGYLANHDTYYQHGIWKTMDGGANWTRVTVGISTVPRVVHFPMDNQTGYAIGANGDFLKTTDGGQSCLEGNMGQNANMQDVYFFNNHIGYAVGRSGMIAKTTDGGVTDSFAVYLHPNGAGTFNEFSTTVGCSNAWDCVNDQSGNLSSGIPQAAVVTDYVRGESGQRQYFSLQDDIVPGTHRVTAIEVSLYASQWYGSYVALGYQRVGVDASPVETTPFWTSVAAMQPVSHRFGNLNWNSHDINALQIGLRHGSGYSVDAAQLFVKILIEAN